MMQWLIDGRAFDTGSSTRVGRKAHEVDYYEVQRQCLATLYLTGDDEFFIHENIHVGDDDDTGEPLYRDRCVPYSATRAKKWMSVGDVLVYNYDCFGDLPEASAV